MKTRQRIKRRSFGKSSVPLLILALSLNAASPVFALKQPATQETAGVEELADKLVKPGPAAGWEAGVFKILREIQKSFPLIRERVQVALGPQRLGPLEVDFNRLLFLLNPDTQTVPGGTPPPPVVALSLGQLLAPFEFFGRPSPGQPEPPQEVVQIRDAFRRALEVVRDEPSGNVVLAWAIGAANVPYSPETASPWRREIDKVVGYARGLQREREVVDALLGRLNNEQPRLLNRDGAQAAALGALGPVAGDLAQGLVPPQGPVGAGFPTDQELLLRTIGQIQPFIALPSPGINLPAPAVRLEAVRALEQIGAPAASSLPALNALLLTPPADVRLERELALAAVAAVERIAASSATITPPAAEPASTGPAGRSEGIAILTAVSTSDRPPFVRDAALAALGRLSPVPVPAAPVTTGGEEARRALRFVVVLQQELFAYQPVLAAAGLNRTETTVSSVRTNLAGSSPDLGTARSDLNGLAVSLLTTPGIPSAVQQILSAPSSALIQGIQVLGGPLPDLRGALESRFGSIALNATSSEQSLQRFRRAVTAFEEAVRSYPSRAQLEDSSGTRAGVERFQQAEYELKTAALAAFGEEREALRIFPSDTFLEELDGNRPEIAANRFARSVVQGAFTIAAAGTEEGVRIVLLVSGDQADFAAWSRVKAEQKNFQLLTAPTLDAAQRRLGVGIFEDGLADTGLAVVFGLGVGQPEDILSFVARLNPEGGEQTIPVAVRLSDEEITRVARASDARLPVTIFSPGAGAFTFSEAAEILRELNVAARSQAAGLEQLATPPAVNVPSVAEPPSALPRTVGYALDAGIGLVLPSGVVQGTRILVIAEGFSQVKALKDAGIPLPSIMALAGDAEDQGLILSTGLPGDNVFSVGRFNGDWARLREFAWQQASDWLRSSVDEVLVLRTPLTARTPEEMLAGLQRILPPAWQQERPVRDDDITTIRLVFALGV